MVNRRTKANVETMEAGFLGDNGMKVRIEIMRK